MRVHSATATQRQPLHRRHLACYSMSDALDASHEVCDTIHGPGCICALHDSKRPSRCDRHAWHCGPTHDSPAALRQRPVDCETGRVAGVRLRNHPHARLHGGGHNASLSPYRPCKPGLMQHLLPSAAQQPMCAQLHACMARRAVAARCPGACVQTPSQAILAFPCTIKACSPRRRAQAQAAQACMYVVLDSQPHQQHRGSFSACPATACPATAQQAVHAL